jgi:hypothetical protein
MSVLRSPADNRLADREAIVRAMREYDLTQSESWSDLDELSTHTYIDDVEVDPEGIVFHGDSFKGVMSVYVLLQYGKDNVEGFQTSDAFQAHFEGRIEDDEVLIEGVSVDTSPFYEGES